MLDKPARKHHVGLALSGGGAKGFVHVGILKAFDEYGIKPEIISGVSAGSIVSVLYASGYGYKEILNMFKNSHFSDFINLGIPKDGFFKLDGLAKFLKANLPVANIEELKLPTIVCATDFDHGVPVKFESGGIIDRVIASCSIPIIFRPHKINGINYVDGGVVRNLPAWAIRRQCDILIGANCQPIVNKTYKPTLLSVAQRSFDLLVKYNATPDMRLCDVVIKTEEASNYTAFSIQEMDKLFNIGYQKAVQVIESTKLIDKLSK